MIEEKKSWVTPVILVVLLVLLAILTGCATCPPCVPRVEIQTVEIKVPVPQPPVVAPAQPVHGLAYAAMLRGASLSEILEAALAEIDDLKRYVAEDAPLHREK